MPVLKMTDEEFLAKTAHLFADPSRTPTWKELAKASGLSIGGARYKADKCEVRRESRFVFQRR